eukprot:3124153-Amphidinium_carterae.2
MDAATSVGKQFTPLTPQSLSFCHLGEITGHSAMGEHLRISYEIGLACASSKRHAPTWSKFARIWAAILINSVTSSRGWRVGRATRLLMTVVYCTRPLRLSALTPWCYWQC